MLVIKIYKGKNQKLEKINDFPFDITKEKSSPNRPEKLLKKISNRLTHPIYTHAYIHAYMCALCVDGKKCNYTRKMSNLKRKLNSLNVKVTSNGKKVVLLF